jgi:hypothetical protein
MNYCRAIALKFGYVENNTVSWLIFQAEGKMPTSRKEALYSLTEMLYTKYLQETDHNQDNIYHMAQCCQKAWYNRDYKNPPIRCPNCEALYKKKDIFNVTNWLNWLDGLFRSTIDGYGGEFEENKYGWEPFHYQFDVPQHNMLIIGEEAETIITYVLRDIHPELIDNVIDDEYNIFNSNNIKNEPTDLINMLNEDYIFKDHCYVNKYSTTHLVSTGDGTAQLQTVKNPSQTITTEYPDGRITTIKDYKYTYIKYNTGDQIWLKIENDKYIVYKIETHDGSWTY